MGHPVAAALLALDSSGPQASVAVGVGGELRAEVVIEDSLELAAGLIPAAVSYTHLTLPTILLV